jgi:hypothetical protein
MINKYIIATSAVLNAILLMVLFGLIPFLLYLSVIINIFLIWSVFKSLESAEEIRSSTEQVLESVETFLEHLEEIYGLETFYGDQTLKDLIDHSREIINDFVEFQEKYYDVEEQKQEEDQELYDGDQEET